jgi:hypothetical protein
LVGADLGSSTPYEAYLDRGTEERLDGKAMEIVNDIGIVTGGPILVDVFRNLFRVPRERWQRRPDLCILRRNHRRGLAMDAERDFNRA